MILSVYRPFFYFILLESKNVSLEKSWPDISLIYREGWEVGEKKKFISELILDDLKCI